MNYQEVKPLYFNKEKLIKSPKVIYRSQIGSHRFYYSLNQGMIKSDPSVTTILDAEMKQPEWLIKWIAEWGYRRAMAKRDEASDYGTIYTILSAQFLRERKFDLETIEPRLQMFAIDRNINYPIDFWNYKLREDLYALNQFVIDYEVEPLAVEIVLQSDKGFAGAIDAVVEMTVGTGVNMRILKSDRKYDKKTGELIEDKTRRVTAIIDWKSGRHGFSRNNEAQLHLYKILWEENFPHLPVDALFNWSPKEWADEGDSLYNLKEQSCSSEQYKVMNYVNNFLVDYKEHGNRPHKVIDGVLELGVQNGNLKYETIGNKIKKNSEKDEFLKGLENDYNAPVITEVVEHPSVVQPDEKALKNHTVEGAIINQLENILGS